MVCRTPIKFCDDLLMNNAMTSAYPHLNANELSVLKAALQTRLDDLLAKDAELRGRLADEESATSNTFVAGGEGAMSDESDEEVLALMHHEQAEVAALKQALQRFDAGQYGWCTSCGEAISAQRLQAVPEAALCLDCKSAAEKRHVPA